MLGMLLDVDYGKAAEPADAKDPYVRCAFGEGEAEVASVYELD